MCSLRRKVELTTAIEFGTEFELELLTEDTLELLEFTLPELEDTELKLELRILELLKERELVDVRGGAASAEGSCEGGVDPRLGHDLRKCPTSPHPLQALEPNADVELPYLSKLLLLIHNFAEWPKP